jgi:hypothetical protein
MPSASLRNSSRLRLNIVLAAAAIIVSLYAAETAARALLALRAAPSDSPCAVGVSGGEWNLINQRSCEAARAAGLPFDTRSRLEVVLAHEAAGTPALPAVHAVSFLSDPPRLGDGSLLLPLSGISRAPTVYCNESGSWVHYDADEFGFRNSPGAHAEQGGIVLIGDSFAKGMCVPDGSTLAGQLATTRGRVLGLGADGSGPLLALAALREYGARVRPAHVVWLFYEGNDLRNLEREKTDPVVARYLEPGFNQDLVAVQPRIDSLLREVVRHERAHAEQHLDVRWFDAVHSFLHLARVRDAARSAYRRVTRPTAPFDSVTFAQTVETMRREVDAWGGRLLFVHLPAWERFALDAGNPHHDAVLRIVADHGVAVLDVVPAFRSVPEPTSLFPFAVSGHYTAEGYALVAREIERALAAFPVDSSLNR